MEPQIDNEQKKVTRIRVVKRASEENMNVENKRIVKAINRETFIFLAGLLIVFGGLGAKMGVANMFGTMMHTAHQLLLNTVFFIMALAVLAGAISALLSEFGVVALINKVLSPLMKPLYDLPGAASVGIITAYFSDNPAIISLAKDKGFARFFKKYQMPAMANLGTSFGMGLIVTTFMISQAKGGQSFVVSAIIGNIGAMIGGIVSVRLVLRHTKKIYGTELPASSDKPINYDSVKYREIRGGSTFQRFLEAMLDGGKGGVEMGMSIIPGVLIICTLVMMLTNGPSTSGAYTGAAFEGVGFLTWLGGKLSFILNPLLGFKHAEAIAFPITSLGAVGAAIGLVPNFLKEGLIGPNEIAVFTAMGMCWSGYLSTNIAIMDALGVRSLTNRSILSHAIGGLVAGVSAHFLYLMVSMVFKI